MAREGDTADPSTSAPVETNPAPQFAQSLRAAETAWLRMEDESGLLRSGEVATLLGADLSNHGKVPVKRAGDEIVGVLRGTEYRYPAFQFDRDLGRVLPVIAPGQPALDGITTACALSVIVASTLCGAAPNSHRPSSTTHQATVSFPGPPWPPSPCGTRLKEI